MLLFALAGSMVQAQEGSPLAGTRHLEGNPDLADVMVTGIDRFLERQIAESTMGRERHWRRDVSSTEAYTRSVEPNRQRLRKYLGVVDARMPAPQVGGDFGYQAGLVSRGTDRSYTIEWARWPVFDGVDVEALVLTPKEAPRAAVVALPDCDWTPEMLAGVAGGVPAEAQFARRLAESGCRVVVPVLLDRSDTYSGNPLIRMTNQPHREFIYRGAFELGRHVIGYEVQKVLACVDLLRRDQPTLPVGVAGYGEGGLLALYSAALDDRIGATVVSGYFGPREELWREPIYRNVWGLLDEFGDAEVASLIAPRTLLVEASAPPRVSGPPAPRAGRSGAAPGAIPTPPIDRIRSELERARRLTSGLPKPPTIELEGAGEGLPGRPESLKGLLRALTGKAELATSGAPSRDERPSFDPQNRMRRQVEQLVELNERHLRLAPERREAFWAKADRSNAAKWVETSRQYRDYFWDEVIGRFPAASLPANARSRLLYDEPAYRGYEVALDVWPDVIASGILLVPKDLKPGERRPVVVCQHGLEGRPRDVADPKVENPAYHRYAVRLAEQAFVTFAPQNPYLFQDRFRVLQRKANPLKKSLFAVIVRQHERILEWLGAQPFVDPKRIGFYGLSYGGKTAMRVPALLEGYCLSICSADYNEWIWKNVTTRARYSYMFTGEYEMPEFDLGNTFNYGEMSWLIFPRPFMVERGHDDGVAPDEWVAYEFARTFRHYSRLGHADKAEIEFFNGPHTINGVGTFEFLRKHLGWPAAKRKDGSGG